MQRFFILLFLLSFEIVQAQKLVPYTKNKLWGYSDLEQNVVISPKYKRADLFHNGLARVKSAENDLYGIINENDEVIIPFEYESSATLGHYVNDRIYFKKGELFGFFNGKGEVVIPAQFELVYGFSENSPRIPAKKNGKFGIIDINGNTVLPFEYPSMSKPGESGYITVFTDKGNGVIDMTGKFIVPAIYREKKMHTIEPLPQLKQNFARINRKDGSKDNAVIFSNGKEISYYFSTDNFDNKHFYNQKYLLVKKPKPGGADFALIDINGNPVAIWNNYSFAEAYNSQAVVVGKRKGTDIIYGLINSKGETILKPKYDQIGLFDEKGIARFEYKGKTGFLNDQGKVVLTEREFDGVSSFGFSNDGLIYFKGDQNSGIMTYEGDKLFIDTDQHHYSFTEFGLILRKDKTSKKEAILNREGKVLTDEYGSISSMQYGFKTKSGKMEGALNKSGKVLFPAIYQNIDYVSEGYFVLKKDNLKTLTDLEGQPVLQNKYQDIRLIRGSDNFWVKNTQSKWQTVNKEERPLTGKVYSKIEYFRDGLYNVRADAWGLVDSSGNEVVPTVCEQPLEYVKSDNLLGIIRQGSIIYGYIGKDYTLYRD